jgi:4-hydroxy-tetrahydrodipicolinate synthase
MATPFTTDEKVDLDSFRKSVSFLKSAGVDGVTITGVLGESNRLVDKEREALITTAVSAAGDMPVVVGTSHAGTHATRCLSEMAEDLGASGVMITPSKEGVPLTDDNMVKYFAHTAEHIGIPVVLQDHPASTQVSMSIPLMARLIRELPTITCVKLESVPTPVRITALKQHMAADGREATIMCGLGALYAGFDLKQGIDGFMTGFAFPEALKALVSAANANDWDTVMALYRHWLPLLVYEQQPGVAVRKEVYRLRNMHEVGHVRHPAGGLSPVAAEQIEALIRETLPGVDITQPLSVDALLKQARS